ncbi:Protein kinase domain-containing protein [Mycena kentingensis (nom. inval.)]|nr:Protein kinase domain-containing protein [Mycena kentingensis (nom. inval.)]
MADNISKLEALHPPADPQAAERVIAVDLDDVLSQTNAIVAQWHNERYGTHMELSHFYYFYYWKNPFWGTPQETMEKVKEFYKTDYLFRAPPVPGAREGIQALRDLGYKLVIVTARNADVADASWEWVQLHFPNLFSHIVFTGQFKDAHKLHHSELLTNLTKAQVCAELKAQILIDDSAENAIQVSTASTPTPVLLFGEYEWGKRISVAGEGADVMSFDIRLAACGGEKFWEKETLEIPEGCATMATMKRIHPSRVSPWSPLKPNLFPFRTYLMHPRILWFALFGLCAAAAATNRTIDDTTGDSVTGNVPTYAPSDAWEGSSCTSCAIQPAQALAHNGTWSAATYNPTMGSMNITFKFTGTAIYVFFILANNAGDGITTKTAANFTIDGALRDSFTHTPSASTDIDYDQLVFTQKALKNTEHAIAISTEGSENIWLAFDYAIYTGVLIFQRQ